MYKVEGPRDLASGDASPLEALVEDLLPKRSDDELSVAAGQPWMGRATQQGPVIYANLELSERTLRFRSHQAPGHQRPTRKGEYRV